MESIGYTLPRTNMLAGAAARGVSSLARLRLVTGLILIFISLVFLLGVDWDIQWHSVIGRDRTFTPPHDMMLTSIGLSGIVALISILIETRLALRHPQWRAYSTEFGGVLRSSLGSYLVGFGAVCAAVAFPLDTYWHALYGVDLSLWAPFHTMIYMGVVLSIFGVIYLLLSAAHLAQMQNASLLTRFSYAGVVVSLGILFSNLSTFLTPAISDYSLHLASLTISLILGLLALVAVFVCVLASKLVPWPGAASIVVLALLLLLLLVSAFVPPMMTWLVQAEHQTYLARASTIGSTIEALKGQTPVPLLLALSLDGVVWLRRRGRWTLARQNTWMLVVALVSMLLAAVILTLIALLAARAAISVTLVLDIVLALLLTIPGSLLGYWLASMVSQVLQTLWR